VVCTIAGSLHVDTRVFGLGSTGTLAGGGYGNGSEGKVMKVEG
jgi:hypothetical protein